MAGVEIAPAAADGTYLGKVKPIAAAEWVSQNPVPAVVAYGTHDRVDHKYFELPHSGHGLQNDDAISWQWMESIDAYLDRYMPVE